MAGQVCLPLPGSGRPLSQPSPKLPGGPDELIGLNLGLNTALVSLLKRLAAEMIAVFESRDDHRKALAAFLLFQKAAEAEQVTLGLLQEVAASLERTRRAGERG